ncbi:MAG: SH3 domain-containing protein, partial [Candidatus Dormibacteraceae bacterium]
MVAALIVFSPTKVSYADTSCGSFNPNAYVWAAAVKVRTGPHLSSTAVGECGPSPIKVDCESDGDEVTYGPYRNHWWAFVESNLGDIHNGYMPAIFIKGGSNDNPLPGVR